MPRSGCNTQGLVELLDAATNSDCTTTIAGCVKDALVTAVKDGSLKLDESSTVPCSEAYGRRHLHTDPNGRYSVVAMIWGEGQGTPIHDHDDKWCVECVYQGEIVVTSYDIGHTADPNRVTMKRQREARATLGEAGALIPPHDYHVIENQSPETAVTIHVYGGEMTGCHVFEPIEEGALYEKKWKDLCYKD